MAVRQYKKIVDLKRDVEDNIIRKALELTYAELFEKLKEYIEKDVYDDSNITKVPNPQNDGWYKNVVGRTYDMLDAFRYNTYRYNKEWKGRIEFVPSEITIDSNNPFIHNNLYPTTFLKILNEEVKQGEAFGFPDVQRKPFWDDFMNYANENSDRIFSKYLLKFGIKPIARRINN